MLHHEDSSQNIPAAPPFPAAQVRVTPEELAAAVARLEARKAGTDGRIAIGEAVRELSLDATSEEVLAEVQAGRQAQTPAPLQKKQRRGLRFVASAALIGLLVGGSNLLFVSRSVTPGPATISPAINLSPTAPQPASITAPNDLLVRDASGKIVLLSEVPDNQPVYATLTATDTSAQWTNVSSDSSSAAQWILIKHGGRVYLRGWIADMSDAALRSSIVEIHPPHIVYAGQQPAHITLPLDNFRSVPGLTNDEMINADHIQPDTHFREKW